MVRDRQSGKTDTASVTITPVLERIELTPASMDLLPGATRAFSATGWMTDGNQSAVSVSWTATGGTITGAGVYSAGTTPGTFRVVARTTSGTLADTAVVRIVQPSATLTRLTLSPDAATAPVNGQVAFQAQALWSDGSTGLPQLLWSAQAGTISSEGLWTAPAAAGSYRVIARHSGGTVADTAMMQVVVPAASVTALSVTPKAPGVLGGQQVTFAAQASWTDGSTTLPALQWTATGGTLTQGSTWTAPNVAGVYRVVARQIGGTVADTAVVTVTETPRVTLLRVTPGLAALVPGATQQFTAQPTWSDGVARSVSPTWTATGGSISVNGLFTAGQLAGQVLVIASCAGCAVADTAELTITQPTVAAPVVNQIVLNPSALTMGAGEARELAVAASWSDGSTTLPPLVWTPNGGAMQGFHYIAGNTAGTFLLVVRHTGSAVADTSTVTITGGGSPGATLSALSLNPSSVTMAPGEQRTLTVGATWSDGSTTVPPLTWAASGGTLNGLVYTAGTTPGSYQIIATHQGGTRADTTAVTIQASASATLQAMTVTPASASVETGALLQFGVTGTWSDGSTTPPAVTWTATGGTISSGGLYTAGGTTGTFQVTATHAASGLTAQRSVTITAQQAWSVVEPELPRATVDVTYPQLTGQTINVAAGGNLQSAINGAACGDEILLAPGASFVGNFVLPAKSCSGWIVIRSNTVLPPPGTRITPATAVSFARLITPNNMPALSVASNAQQYRVVGVEVGAQPSVTSVNSLVNISANQANSLGEIPRDIIFDRLYVHGHPTLALMRCVLLDGVRAAVVDSYLSECHIKGFDSQAILMYGTPGPVAILNNYLEGAGENVMIGGAAPKFSNLIPSDIVIQGNHFYKPPAWKGLWTIKNLFEIKNARRVLLEGNILENSWADGQTGGAVLIKSANSGGGAPWTEVTDVTVRYNHIHHTLQAVDLASAPSPEIEMPVSRVKIEHNLFEHIGQFNGTTSSYMTSAMGSQAELNDAQFVHNTGITGISTSLMSLAGNVKTSQRFVVRDNHLVLGQYGIKASGGGSGTAALAMYFASYSVRGNSFVGAGSLASSYPGGNTFLSSGAAPGLGTDGTPAGANMAEVLRQTGLARSGNR